MAATAAQIATYLSALQTARADYMADITLKEKLGRVDIYPYRVVASVLNCYITAMNKYLSEPLYDIDGNFLLSYNFYDEEEAEDVMLRINKICDTNYYLDL